MLSASPTTRRPSPSLWRSTARSSWWALAFLATALTHAVHALPTPAVAPVLVEKLPANPTTKDLTRKGMRCSVVDGWLVCITTDAAEALRLRIELEKLGRPDAADVVLTN